MKRNTKRIVEFRFYEKPMKEPVLALMGTDWIRDFGEDITCLHFHNLMEIGYCVWGKGEIILNKGTYHYEKGTFTLIPHNILHGTNSERNCHWEYLFFDVEDIVKEQYKDNQEKVEKIITSIVKNGKIYKKDIEPYLCSLIQTIFELMKNKKKYYKETIKGILYAIAMQLAAENEETDYEIGSVSVIAPALTYIAKHYAEDIRIQNMAACCHLSETHFRRVFHEDMNMTPIEYVNLVRVQRACDMMKKGNDHMEEVAVKVGYQTISTFNRNFRKIIGMSPYQWKKKSDQENEKIGDYHISAKKGW